MVKPAWLGEEWRQKEVRVSEKGGGEKDRRTGQKDRSTDFRVKCVCVA